jgi:hypothetical protein
LFIAPPSLHYLASPGITIVCSTTPSLAKLTPLHIPSEAKCLCTDKSERYRPDDTLSIRNDIITIVTNIIFRIEDGACKQTKPCPREPGGRTDSLELVFRSVLANELTQIRSDPVPGLSVDTLGAFQIEIAVTCSELGIDRSG